MLHIIRACSKKRQLLYKGGETSRICEWAPSVPETISDWELNFRDYQYIGTITASIESREDFGGDIVGVFVDGECRGIAERMYFPFDDSYFYLIQVYSHETDSE